MGQIKDYSYFFMSNPCLHVHQQNGTDVSMWVWRTFGSIAFIMGAIGIVLPIWPTTIFWIVAAICFARSNPDWRDWIYARPGVGQPIEEFVERGVLGRKSKILAMIGMFVALAGMLVAFRHHTMILASGLAILGLGSLYVLTRPAP